MDQEKRYLSAEQKRVIRRKLDDAAAKRLSEDAKWHFRHRPYDTERGKRDGK